MKKLVFIFVSVLATQAFAHIDNFEDAVKNATPVQVSQGQCRINVTDKSNGVTLVSDEFSPVANRFTGNKYLSLWKFHLGSDDSNLFASVEPFVDAKGKLLLHVIIVNDHGNGADTGKAGGQASVELIGAENTDGQVAFHSWASNKFDFRDAGKQSDVVGSHTNGVFNLDSKTDELDYSLSCKF